jgi:Family of unknown function (DUF6962)
MISELSISAITDIILSCELFFLSGLCFRPAVQTGSPVWLWGVTLALTGLGAMIGAIDHGFFEPIEHHLHRDLIIATRVTVVIGSLSMIVAVAQQYLSGGLRSAFVGLAVIGAVWPIYIISTSDDLLPVMIYYSVGFLFTLALSIIYLRQNTGTKTMIVAIFAALGVTALIPLGSQGFWGMGLFGTYHVLLMPVVVLLYLGGRPFRTTRVAPSPLASV